MSTSPELESSLDGYPTTPPSDHLLSIPSIQIDSAICDLIAHVENYSDADFDTQWMHITNAEIELLVILLVRSLTRKEIGKLLSEYLLELRVSKE